MTSDVFLYENDQLSAAGVPLGEIARAVPTPFYVYDPAAALARFRGLSSAFAGVPHLHCVALKANSQPALLRPLFAEGAGAEVVSGAELALALALGLPGARIVFSGVGKTDHELASGIEADVLLFLVESETELRVLDALAREAGRKARVALRLNPDIDAKTHPHIATGVATAKFGIDPDEALKLYRNHRDFENLEFVGVHSHIGSQITELGPLAENARALSALVRLLALSGVPIRYVDIGGGLGIPYRGESTPALDAYAEGVAEPLRELGVTLLTEPGRVLFGPVGALVARVLYVKRVHGREFVVLDAGLNDLLRPALYGAYHRVVPLARREREVRAFDVAGAVCESSDVFARDRELPEPQRGEHLAILDAGAYGFAMSSNYNLRPRPAEVVVEEGGFRVVREAETVASLVARELGRISVTATTRKLVLVVLLSLLVFALALYLQEGPTWQDLGMAVFLILIWTPLKGLIYRRLEASKPYEGALAANASSELAGLPVHLGLSFWPLMGVSFLVSAAIETLALAAMGSATSWRRCLFLAVYGSLVVHLMTVGWFASHRSLALGIPFLLAGIALFHLPAMK